MQSETDSAGSVADPDPDPDPDRSDDNKWECEFCTFQNWEVALRCTMCRAARTASPKVITENAHNQNTVRISNMETTANTNNISTVSTRKITPRYLLSC